MALWEGWTYAIYTACETAKGDAELSLYNQKGERVAAGERNPFCAPYIHASLVKYTMPCGASELGAFSLLQACAGDSACAGAVQIEYNTSVPTADCAPPPPHKADAASGTGGELKGAAR